jgi:hypothetical protein
MKGATVDTMALAVEGSAVVLLGVSRAYKESSNCRMEAQYALQKKKPLIPLMLTQGYEPDGWLGLLLGTSMWYGFYGETLSSGSAFDVRMDALCREIGGRGCADAPVAVPSEHVAGTATPPSGSQPELYQLKMFEILDVAREAGASEEDIMDAQDADDAKAAVIALVIELRRQAMAEADSATLILRAELEGMRMRELMARAKAEGIDAEALKGAQGSEEPKASIVDLLLGAALAMGGE